MTTIETETVLKSKNRNSWKTAGKIAFWTVMSVAILAAIVTLVGLVIANNSPAKKLSDLGFDTTISHPLDSLSETTAGQFYGGGSFFGFDSNGQFGPNIKFAMRTGGDTATVLVMPYTKFTLHIDASYAIPRVSFNVPNNVTLSGRVDPTVAGLLQAGTTNGELYLDENVYRKQIAPYLSHSG